MERIKIAAVYAGGAQLDGQTITVCGWARTIRDMKTFGFLELNDGSCFRNLQVVMDANALANYKEVAGQNVGAALIVTGKLVLTPEAKQPLEVKAERIEIEGVSSPEKALILAGGPDAENLWIIGGGSIYAALLSRCRRVYLTRVETRVQESDTFFPNLDKLPNWEVASEGEPMEEDGMKFRFLEYVNTKLAG